MAFEFRPGDRVQRGQVGLGRGSLGGEIFVGDIVAEPVGVAQVAARQRVQRIAHQARLVARLEQVEQAVVRALLDNRRRRRRSFGRGVAAALAAARWRRRQAPSGTRKPSVGGPGFALRAHFRKWTCGCPDAARGAADKPQRPFDQLDERCLPEEVVDHVDHLAVPHVDQQRVVIIADPAIARRGIGQAVLPRVVEPVVAPVIARPQPRSDRVGPIAPAERIVIEAEVEQRAVVAAMVAASRSDGPTANGCASVAPSGSTAGLLSPAACWSEAAAECPAAECC